MPKVKSEITHDLGRDEAVRRLRDACRRAHAMTDLRESWAGDVLTFSVSIQGVKVSGDVEVTENSLKLVGKIPIIALPFKSWIPNILKHAVKDRREIEEKLGKISTEPLVLYLHIPKAGGTTLGEFIYNQSKTGDENHNGLIRNGVFFMSDGFFREAEPGISPQTQGLLRRPDLRAVMGHFAFGIHDGLERPYRYLTILRDPVKRVISLYHYLKLEGTMSLTQFAESAPYREIDNDQTRRIAGINPEVGGLTSRDLETAKENLRKYFAVVGTTERFDETLVLLRQKLNWKKDIPSYPRNVSGAQGRSAAAADIEALRQRNLFDIELHDFANQLMDEMIAAGGRDFEELLDRQRSLNSEKK